MSGESLEDWRWPRSGTKRIETWRLQCAVQDGETVASTTKAAWRSSRSNAKRPNNDLDFKEATEVEEVERKEKLKTKYARRAREDDDKGRVKVVTTD